MLRVEACFFHSGSDLPWGTVGGWSMWRDSVSLRWNREVVLGCLKDKYLKFVPSDIMEGHAPQGRGQTLYLRNCGSVHPLP